LCGDEQKSCFSVAKRITNKLLSSVNQSVYKKDSMMGTKLAIGIDIEPFVRQAITRNLNREEKKRLEIQKKQIKIIIEELKFLQ
jgi:hypothetical protein